MFGSDPTPLPTYCFSVSAAPDASVMPRVLGLFAKRGIVPARFHGDVVGDELAIDLQVRGLDHDAANHIAETLRSLVTVDRVLLAVKRETSQVRA